MSAAPKPVEELEKAHGLIERFLQDPNLRRILALNQSGHEVLSVAKDVLAWALGRPETVFHLELRILLEATEECGLRLVHRADGWRLEPKPAARERETVTR